jgi:hypothetical protein
MPTLRVAELETLFTAKLDPYRKGAEEVDRSRTALAKSDTVVKVTAESKGAVADLDKVRAEAKATGSLSPEVVATADVGAAIGDLGKVASETKGLPDGEVQVTADTSAAKGALDGLEEDARTGGEEAGAAAGKGLAGEVVAAITTIPIAGAIVGVGVAIGGALVDGIRDGLDNELREDEVAARTGLDEATVSKLGRAAGEAYANNFGESIRGNLTTAQQAIQNQLLDPSATKYATQNMLQQIDGVATVLQQDIPAVIRSTTQLLRTGLAGSAQEAFDIIVKGQQAGLNVSEDWLDTIDEYATQWRSLGLTGGQVLGLLTQGLRAGARDTDVVTDALKELVLRVNDGSAATSVGFGKIGVSASEMQTAIAAGGTTASDMLARLLTGMNAIEDPAARNAAALALFGTKAEDMGAAIYGLDLTTATEQLGDFAGAAKSAIDTLGDNSASQVESAVRNIGLAADGVKGALAAAFGPQLDQAATWVQSNRGPLMEFLAGVANGAIELGIAFVNGVATATEAVGTFVAGPLADVVDGIAAILNGLDNIPGVDTGDAEKSMRNLAEEMRGADEATENVADTLRTNLIENGLKPAQERLNGFLDPLIADAAVHDALVRTSASIDGVGLAADGSALAIADMVTETGTATLANGALRDQLTAVSGSLADQLAKAQAAGEGQEDLTARYNATRDSLINQLTQMGLTQGQAQALADTYLSIPGAVNTSVTADTTAAEAVVTAFTEKQRHIAVKVGVSLDEFGGAVYSTAPNNRQVLRFEHDGGLLLPMASGGKLTPMAPRAARVPPDTWRVVGDRLDVPEWYIPEDGSAESARLALGAARATGAVAMAGGGQLVPMGSTSVGAPGLTRADLDYLIRGIAQVVLSGSRDVSAASQAAVARSLQGSRSTVGVVR